MSSYLIVVAMRTKGIGFLGVFWLMYAYLFLFKFKEKGAMYLGGGLVAVIFGMSAIKDYFSQLEDIRQDKFYCRIHGCFLRDISP